MKNYSKGIIMRILNVLLITVLSIPTIACIDTPGNDDAVSSASNALESVQSQDTVAAPKPGPTQDPRMQPCGVQSGATRFIDNSTSRCGYLFGNNTFWGDFGWNDRADLFVNDGNTHSNCLYQDIACGGQALFLPRGYGVEWPNIVSSNRWTTASSCSNSSC